VTAGTCRASLDSGSPYAPGPGDASGPAPGPHHRDAPGTGDVRAPKLNAGPAPNAIVSCFAPTFSFPSAFPSELPSELESESESAFAARRTRRRRDRRVAAAGTPARRPAPARRGGDARFGGGLPPKATRGAAFAAASRAALPLAYAASALAAAAASADAARAAATTADASPAATRRSGSPPAAGPGPDAAAAGLGASLASLPSVMLTKGCSRSGYAPGAVTPYPPTFGREPIWSRSSSTSSTRLFSPGDGARFDLGGGWLFRRRGVPNENGAPKGDAARFCLCFRRPASPRDDARGGIATGVPASRRADSGCALSRLGTREFSADAGEAGPAADGGRGLGRGPTRARPSTSAARAIDVASHARSRRARRSAARSRGRRVPETFASAIPPRVRETPFGRLISGLDESFPRSTFAFFGD
jgi:hypothetical protein